jgi:hypothetical protein
MAKNRADRYASAKQMLRDLVPPAPQSADDRKRAPGGRPRSEPAAALPRENETRIERGSRASIEQPPVVITRPRNEPVDGASATLRSRMAEAHQQQPDRATRIERKPKLPPSPSPFERPGRQPEPPLPPLRGSILESEDSIEIPIHVTAPAREHDDDEDAIDVVLEEEDPTEIFRPGKHPRPAPARRPNAQPAVSDDWDGDTVVNRPDLMPPRAPHPGQRAPRDVPFNPEKTMKLTGSELDQLANRHAPPRRR